MFPPIIISEAWPWFMLLPSEHDSRLGEWITSYCIHGDFFHFAFPDEATFIQFKFTFPGLIPDNIWYTELTPTMINKTTFEYVFGPESLMTLSEKLYYKKCEEIALSLDVGEIEQLQSLFESGPLFDGETISPNLMKRLLDRNLAVKIVIEGEDGYNACTHTGAWVWRYLKHLDSPK